MADDDSADRLVARAIESVLDQVPGRMDTAIPEASAAKMQPWAETAAPAGAHGKRPLSELLGELETRVAADPGAQAQLPRTRHPALAFFDRFSKAAQSGRGSDRAAPGEPGSRRRRRRRGAGSGATPAAEASTVARPASAEEGRGSGRRRSRRGRGGGGGGAPQGGGPTNQAAPSRGSAQRSPNGQPPPGDGGGRSASPGGSRRRRGRRGRGGPRPPAA